MIRFWILLLGIFFLIGCKKTQSSQSSTNLPGPPAPNGTLLQVTVNQNQAGNAIPPNFQGLSYEAGILNNNSNFLSANNAVLIQLIKNLGSGMIRIGGNSSDNISWTGFARGNKTGSDSLTTTDIDNFVAFAKAVGWPVLFGVNLGSNNPLSAANESGYLKSALGNLLYAIQIGNEPDLYYNNGHRTSSYTYNNYQTEWNSYFSAIKNLQPQAPFAGPDVAYNTNWISSFSTNESSNVILIDGHYYNTGPATSPSITYQTILTPNTQLTTYLQSLNAASTKYHLPFRISECNSVYDGGKAGVSNVFASALWALDYMWTVVENNGLGVNFHGGNGGAYSPFVLSNSVITAQPEYYAMLAFKYGTNGGNLLPVSLSASAYNCTAYACKNGNATYVTLINKDTVNNLSFSIQLNQSVGTIQLARLSAPTITSTSGIQFAGSTVNTDGSFKMGTLEQYAVNKNNFVVNVPSGSAVVVTAQ